MPEIDHAHALIADLQRQPINFAMRQLKKLVEQAELANELKGGRMHGIAAKVAEKI